MFKVKVTGRRSHESRPVDKGKSFQMQISVLLFGKRGLMNFEIVHTKFYADPGSTTEDSFGTIEFH